MKIIKLTESDETNIVKRVIEESAAKDSLIDMVKYDGWDDAAELVGGDENLAKLAFNNEPMNFLHMFDDLDVVQSKENPNWILYRYEKRNNMMFYNKKNDEVYINYSKIWQFLEESFGLDFNEIQEVMKEWLFEVYNLRGVTTSQGHLLAHREVV